MSTRRNGILPSNGPQRQRKDFLESDVPRSSSMDFGMRRLPLTAPKNSLEIRCERYAGKHGGLEPPVKTRQLLGDAAAVGRH